MKTRLLFVLLFAVAALIFVLRRPFLRQLQSEEGLLQHRIEEADKLYGRVQPAAATAVAPRAAALSPEERRELIRLRGEVGVLRAELVDVTRTPARPARPTPQARPATEPTEPIPPRSVIITRMNLGKQWMLALMIHADSNNGRLPANLAEVANLLGQGGNTAEGDRFELVLQGALKEVPAPATTIVLREKQPWRSARDRWSRIYAFADGHVETANSATEDFTEWEEQRRARAVPGP